MFVFCPNDEVALSTHNVLLKKDAYTIYGQITVCLKGHPCGFKKTLRYDPRAPQLFNTTQYIIIAGPVLQSSIFQYYSYCTCAYFFLR